jgi:transmembrane sensor
MSNAAEKIHDVIKNVRVEWNDRRAYAIHGRILRRVRQESSRRTVLAFAAVVLAVLVTAGVTFELTRGRPVIAKQAPAGDTAELALRIDDGSKLVLLEPDTVVETQEVTAERVVVDLVRGSAEFDVAKNPQRRFRVRVSDVTVEVIGTKFKVEHMGRGARVTVTNGRVRVMWDGHERVLQPGESDQFPPVYGKKGVPQRAESAEPQRETAAPAKPWRELARDAEFQHAYEALKRAGAADVRDDPEDLLLAADVARLSRHPEQAVPHLRAVISRHTRDPRAPLAAFTLGRVLLESLGNPREAALAFRRAQELAPSGVLTEDAHAREVEALSRAGESQRARDRAEQYLKTYPSGRKVRAVRMYGGLD